jgi:hypothetical protein
VNCLKWCSYTRIMGEKLFYNRKFPTFTSLAKCDSHFGDLLYDMIQVCFILFRDRLHFELHLRTISTHRWQYQCLDTPLDPYYKSITLNKKIQHSKAYNKVPNTKPPLKVWKRNCTCVIYAIWFDVQLGSSNQIAYYNPCIKIQNGSAKSKLPWNRTNRWILIFFGLWLSKLWNSSSFYLC